MVLTIENLLHEKGNYTGLELELWLRQRNSSSICGTTKEDKDITIKDMDNNHLVNTIKMLERQAEEAAIIAEHIGDMNPMDYYD